MTHFTFVCDSLLHHWNEDKTDDQGSDFEQGDSQTFGKNAMFCLHTTSPFSSADNHHAEHRTPPLGLQITASKVWALIIWY